MRVVLKHLPADMHNHPRQPPLLRTLVQTSCRLVGYEAEEPNTDPPIITAQQARKQRARILRCVSAEARVTYHPIMGVYVSNESDPDDIAQGWRAGDVAFIKWYPPHGTTGSALSVPIMSPSYCRMAAMAEKEGIPFQHHGELTHNGAGEELDHQDRESAFYLDAFPEIRRRWPGMRYLGEHLTTEEGVSAILEDQGTGGTITPWHLLEDRRIVNRGGMNPLYAIMPALKRERHKLAIREAVARRCPRLFAGTDRAAHPLKNKARPVGCACGIYSPWWIDWYATAFEQMGLLEYLEQFLCIDGPRHYGYEPIAGRVLLEKSDVPRYPEPVRYAREKAAVILPFGYHHDPKDKTGLLKPCFWRASRLS